ncbi:Alpha/Beta hydrolase protein [Mrakia frigida]|uniref:alpha/beta fold hydrolase n=1 Tax=Mrakia frigida TaxID=29902 RepID=UPI003FCC1D6D
MPFIDVPPSSNPLDTAPLRVHYQISTPTDSVASAIDPSLPCVLFLHPLFFAAETFHDQFGSPSLRQFNLIGLDFRVHGSTFGEVWKGFALEDLGEDVSRFITALDIPPVHVVGLSLGASAALWLSINHPSQVASTTIMSIFSPRELPEVAAGRAEIARVWLDGVEQNDMSAYNDAAFGSIQLFFGDQSIDKARRLAQYYSMPQDLAQWNDAATCERIRILGVDTVVTRTVVTTADLAKITSPVLVVHGENDLAYPTSTATDLKSLLDEAGVKKTKLTLIPDAPHFCSVHASKEINALLSSWVLSNIPESSKPLSLPTDVVSPWQAGLYPADDPMEVESSEEEDDE